MLVTLFLRGAHASYAFTTGGAYGKARKSRKSALFLLRPENTYGNLRNINESALFLSYHQSSIVLSCLCADFPDISLIPCVNFAVPMQMCRFLQLIFFSMREALAAKQNTPIFDFLLDIHTGDASTRMPA